MIDVEVTGAARLDRAMLGDVIALTALHCRQTLHFADRPTTQEKKQMEKLQKPHIFHRRQKSRHLDSKADDLIRRRVRSEYHSKWEKHNTQACQNTALGKSTLTVVMAKLFQSWRSWFVTIEEVAYLQPAIAEQLHVL